MKKFFYNNPETGKPVTFKTYRAALKSWREMGDYDTPLMCKRTAETASELGTEATFEVARREAFVMPRVGMKRGQAIGLKEAAEILKKAAYLNRRYTPATRPEPTTTRIGSGWASWNPADVLVAGYETRRPSETEWRNIRKALRFIRMYGLENTVYVDWHISAEATYPSGVGLAGVNMCNYTPAGGVPKTWLDQALERSARWKAEEVVKMTFNLHIS